MKFISLAFVLVLGLVLAGCHGNPFHKMYSAMADVEVRPQPESGIVGRNGVIPPLPYDPTLALAETQDMLSDANLAPVIQKMKLDQIWAKRLGSDHDTLSPEEALDHLRKTLKIESLRGTDIFRIIVYSEVPQEAADIANAVADSYKTQREQDVAAHNKQDLDDPKNKDHLKQLTVDQMLQESPVRIIARAVAPPE